MSREGIQPRDMSFINIEDPKKRDQIVADYLATIKRVQQRSEDENTVGLDKQTQLECTFNPVIKATKQSTRSIKESLDPIREELKTVREPVSASGIFLPGDIKGLETKLNLLLAEFQAGNTSTRNEIVFILDELLRRKRMSRKEYTEINNYVSNRT